MSVVSGGTWELGRQVFGPASLALCNVRVDTARAAALCFIDGADVESPPEWIQLFAGPSDVAARDGRAWKKTNPQLLVEAFAREGRDLPIDVEHATEIKGPKGEPAPAVGWMTAIEVRDDGSVWARVKWNDDGVELLTKKRYRYISPAFRFNMDTREILELTSAGLTNNPALHLTALAREQQKEEEMDKELLKLLGLAETASAEDIRKAVQALKDGSGKITKLEGELAEAQTSLKKATDDLATARQATASALKDMVPRADLDSALARAQTAEGKVKDQEAKAFASRVDAAIEQAKKEGKIAPAQEAFYRGVCGDEKGLASFQQFASQSPAIVKEGSDVPPPSTAGNSVITEAERVIIAQCGIDEKTFLEQKKAISVRN